MLSRLLGRLEKVVKTSFGPKILLLTNTLSSGGLFVLGDLIQQKSGTQAHDYERSMRMFAVGLSQGPPHHYWYEALDKKLPGKTAAIIGKKILADQIFAAPFFAVTFIVFAALLEGKRLAQAWREFVDKFPTIYLFDWIIWPPSQAVNFLLVPARFRVLYVNFVTVLWDIFLSYMKHLPEPIE